MEGSLAALTGNLLACSTECASWHLCYSIFLYLSTWQTSRSFCSTRTSQECEHTIFRHHENPAEVNALSAVKRQLEDLAGLTLLWLLFSFSSRQDEQHAVDFRNSSSQAREPCSCVMRWPPQQDTVIGRFDLWLRPCSVVPTFIASRAWGWNWS